MKSLRPWLVGAALLAALGAVSPARADTAPAGQQNAALWAAPDAWSPAPAATDKASEDNTQTWLLGAAAAGVALSTVDWKGSAGLSSRSASIEPDATAVTGGTHKGSRVEKDSTPEPASCLLLGMGVLLAGVRRRRGANTRASAA